MRDVGAWQGRTVVLPGETPDGRMERGGFASLALMLPQNRKRSSIEARDGMIARARQFEARLQRWRAAMR